MKILLVEDSATIRYVMSQYIGDAGHETIIAESGEQALQILDTTPVDMVIMDVEMPGLDGFETTTLIREWLGDHWIPIIFVTGKSEAKSLEEGIAAGGDDYIIKPVNQTILNAKIRAMERITEMRNQLADLNKELTVLSQHDGLTKLYNRRTFEEKAQQLWDQSTRNQLALTVILLDIDHFKLYNDCYGHPAGDVCITQVAQVMARCLNRASDLVGRYGGEEFIAIMSDTNEQGAAHICELIRRSIEALEIRHRDSSCSKVVTVSIGASVVNFTTGTDVKAQISRADQALYESKSNGRNCVTIREFNPQCKVLVVDEREDALEAIKKNLEGHCAVVTSTHAEECVALAEEYFPEVILLNTKTDADIQGLCRILKSHNKIKSIPILIVSSDGEEALKKFGMEVHADGYLTEPLDKNRLLASISKYLH